MKFSILSLVLGIITTLGDHHSSVVASQATGEYDAVPGENGKDLSFGSSIHHHLRSWAASKNTHDSQATHEDTIFQGRRSLFVCKPEIKCVEPKDTNNPVQGCDVPTPLTDTAQVFTVTRDCGKTFTMLTPKIEQDGSACTSVLKGKIIYPIVAIGDTTEKVILNCPQTFKIKDTAKPILLNVPANTIVNCLGDIPDPPTVTATDTACSSTPPGELKVTLTFVDSTHTPTCDNPFTRTRTWTAKDGCGNKSTATQVIKVQYTQPPSFTLTPEPILGLQCASEVATKEKAEAFATATDQCGGAATITLGDDKIDGTCINDFSLARTWTAKDMCGNTNTFLQTITVKDTEPPVIGDLLPIPGNPFQCKSEIEAAAVPAVSFADNCGPGGTASWTSEDTTSPCENDFTRTYTYTAKDLCGNEALPKTISATVEDTEAPVYVDGADQPSPFQCKSQFDVFDASPGSAHFKDNCEGKIDVTLSRGQPIRTTEIAGCKNKFIQEYTWIAADSCGKESDPHTITATVDDTEPPVLTCDGAKQENDFDLCVGGPYPSEYATITTLDNCDETKDLVVVPDCCTDATHSLVTRTWKLQDTCGNVATPCTQKITLSGDTCKSR